MGKNTNIQLPHGVLVGLARIVVNIFIITVKVYDNYIYITIASLILPGNRSKGTFALTLMKGCMCKCKSLYLYFPEPSNVTANSCSRKS
jgi:hypothetical protein